MPVKINPKPIPTLTTPEENAQLMQELNKMLCKVLDPKAFILVVFDMNAPGDTHFVTSAPREQLVEALSEFTISLATPVHPAAPGEPS